MKRFCLIVLAAVFLGAGLPALALPLSPVTAPSQTPYADARNDCSLPSGGSTDASARMAACENKGKRIELPEGVLSMNDTPGSGVNVMGPCPSARSSTYGVSASNYVQPYDHTRPPLQVGADTAYVAGGLYDCVDFEGAASGDGAGAGANGPTLGAGSYDFTLRHFLARGFLGYQVGLIGGNVKNCAHLRLEDGVVVAANGSVGIQITDPNSATLGPNYAFCNDHFGANLYVYADARSTALYVDSSVVHLTNWKSDSGSIGCLFRRSVSWPIVHGGSGFNFDNPNQGAAGETCVYDTAEDVHQSAGFHQVFDGPVQIHGNSLVARADPTITTTAGQATVTVSSTTGIYSGFYGSVRSATANWNFKVLAILDATHFTLDPSGPNATAPYSETSAVAFTGDNLTPTQIRTLATRTWYDAQNCAPAPRSIEPIIVMTAGCVGAPAPFNGYNWTLQFGPSKGFIFTDLKTEVAPSTLSLSGGTIHIGIAGANAHAGDIFCLHDTNEQGFFGCWALATESTNGFDYYIATGASPPDVTAASGAPKVTIVSTGMYFYGGTLTYGIGHFPAFQTSTFGVWTPLSSCGSGGSICIAPPDGSGTGNELLQFGHSVWQTTNVAAAAQDYTNYKNQSWSVTGDGGEMLCRIAGVGASQITKPSVYLCDGLTAVTQSFNAGDGAYGVHGGLPVFKSAK